MIKPIFVYLLFLLCLSSCGSQEGYHRDSNNKWSWKYYHGGEMKYKYVEIDSVDHSTFKKLNSDYGKDKSHVFYQTSIITDADSKTFEIIDGRYSKDANSVYFENQKLVYASPKSFEVLDWPYAKDRGHVYCGTLPLIDLSRKEVDEFRVTKTSLSTMATAHDYFVDGNPEYKWLDTNYLISYGEGGGRTNKRRFWSFREIK